MIGAKAKIEVIVMDAILCLRIDWAVKNKNIAAPTLNSADSKFALKIGSPGRWAKK
jgi:hypothetical protein